MLQVQEQQPRNTKFDTARKYPRQATEMINVVSKAADRRVSFV